MNAIRAITRRRYGDAALIGRKKPYTERGIYRVPCAKCGKPSRYNWAICANDGRHIAVCKACDVALNRIGLEWLLGKRAAAPMVEAYEKWQHPA